MVKRPLTITIFQKELGMPSSTPPVMLAMRGVAFVKSIRRDAQKQVGVVKGKRCQVTSKLL